VARTRIEKRLKDVGRRLASLRTDLSVAEQAVIQVEGEADDARLRALVSETPLAEREHQQVRRQADVQRRNRDELREEIAKLEQRQDELLDQYNES
jgi:chromosome segregation ATPase